MEADPNNLKRKNKSKKIETEIKDNLPLDISDEDLKTKYRAVLLLHALGDTIGFKNGDWEFNYHEFDKRETLDYVNELIYEFISLGGVNGIDLSDWKISDDTFFHIAIAKALLHYKKSGDINKLIKYTKKYMYEEALRIWKESSGTYVDAEGNTVNFNRYIGVTTSEYIKEFKNGEDARDYPYDDESGGNGCAMRTLIIGLCLGKRSTWNDMIQFSVISSQLTHYNALGYLAGFNASLFVALAIYKIPIKEWPYILIDGLRGQLLRSFLSLKNLDQVYDHNMYIRYWQKYLDTKFDKDRNPLKVRSNTNPMHRIRYYYENFHKGTLSEQIGASGFLCMIMAYDALLDCDGCWEKLIVYSMLHSGDSDTVGAVAGGLYGAVYGFGDVPEKMLEHIERKDELENLATQLYEKFH